MDNKSGNAFTASGEHQIPANVVNSTRPLDNTPDPRQLARRSFIHYRAKQAAKCMNPRLNVIQTILRPFYNIHYRV